MSREENHENSPRGSWARNQMGNPDSFVGAIFAVLVMLIATSAPAQNLIVAENTSVLEFTPGGAQSILISPGRRNPNPPSFHGLAFNNAGDLFVASYSFVNSVTSQEPRMVK